MIVDYGQPLTVYNGGGNGVPQGVVYDDVAQLYWHQDLSSFVDQTYAQQKQNIANLPGGNWSMANLDQMQKLWKNGVSLIMSAFYPSKTSYSGSFWNGRYDYNSGLPTSSHYMTYIYRYNDGGYFYEPLNTDTLTDGTIYPTTGAWAVSSEAPVPEPASLLLMGIGIAGLGGVRSRRKKK